MWASDGGGRGGLRKKVSGAFACVDVSLAGPNILIPWGGAKGLLVAIIGETVQCVVCVCEALCRVGGGVVQQRQSNIVCAVWHTPTHTLLGQVVVGDLLCDRLLGLLLPCRTLSAGS